MYKELKAKIKELIPKNRKTTRYEKILLCFDTKLENLKTKDDIVSKEELEIVKRLIQKIEMKIKIEEKV